MTLYFVIAALVVGLPPTVLCAIRGGGPSPIVGVLLDHGKVEGKLTELSSSRGFYSFLGIPYAAPPVGDLRFKDPSPPAPWTNIRRSEKLPPCPHPIYDVDFRGKLNIVGNEDCLYLNVFSAMNKSDLPVMVYIHGGGFLSGDATYFGGGPDLLLQKDIVLVTIEYRLGTLGFMSTGDSVLPGNLGLKDQTFALKWVQENIERFRGDPKKVTIFGQSAGAASPHYHILSPHSRGLFKQAILQAGSALNPWALRNDHQQVMLEGAKKLGCPGTDNIPPDNAQIFQCLKEKSVEDLVRMAIPESNESVYPLYMVPRVDGDFLPAHPAQLLREGRYQKVDLMTGVCQHEASIVLHTIFHNMTAAQVLVNDMDKLAKMFVGMDHEDNFEYLMKRSFYHYVGKLDINIETAADLERLFSHYILTIPLDIAAAFHARDALFGKSTYRYELEHRGESSFVDFSDISSEVMQQWITHVDEQQYIFSGVQNMGELSRPDDVFLSDIMVTLWTNFARTGNPTPDLDLGFKWEPMTSGTDMRYLSLKPAPEMKADNRHEDRQFWMNMPTRFSKMSFPEKFVSEENKC